MVQSRAVEMLPSPFQQLCLLALVGIGWVWGTRQHCCCHQLLVLAPTTAQPLLCVTCPGGSPLRAQPSSLPHCAMQSCALVAHNVVMHACPAHSFVYNPQADLSRARSAAESSVSDVSALRVEAEGLRRALGAMEARLGEYQAKDTEVCMCVCEERRACGGVRKG